MEENKKAEVFYQAFLKNDNSYKYLSEFVRQAEDFNDKNSTYDIVKEYLNISNHCEELLPFVKELASVDYHNAASVLKAMCHILIRVAGDLNAYEAAGANIVKDVLLHGMRLIFQLLRPQKSPKQTKLALHLLASMVALGKQAATQVVTKLDFSHVNFTHLLFRASTGADEDVRSAFLNLIVLILTICDSYVIRQIVEVKGLLNNVFPGLLSDHASTITLVLNTFCSKIVENIDISKTCKLRLFNEYSLKYVIELYSWKGPLKKKKFMKRKLGEDAKSLFYEVTEEEAKEVRLSAHQFMLALCSTNKYGIIFRDTSFGSSGRNFNNAITSILKHFPKPFADPLSSEFVISVLKACPDQFKFFVPLLKESFTPRISVLWVKVIEFFEKAIRSIDVTLLLFKSGTKFPLSTLTSISKTFCLPGLINISVIEDTFSLGHPVLGFYVCNYLYSILEQVKSILDFCQHPTSSLYDATELDTFRKAFLPLVLRNLPIRRGLQSCWNKIVSGENIWLEDETLSGFPFPNCFKQLLTVLKVMKVFQEISQNSQNSYSFDFLQMLNSLQKIESLTKKELLLIRIELVDLIASQLQGTILSEKEDVKNLSFSSMLNVYLTAEEPEEILMAVNLIRKVLWHTKLFDNCKWEIEVWLDVIKNTKSQHLSLIFELLSDSLKVSLAQPNLLLFESFNVDGPLIGINDLVDPLEMLKGIINEDNDDHMEALEVQPIEFMPRKQCFSNLVPAILQKFASLNEQNKEVCQAFVESALLQVLHRQISTNSFFELIQKYKDSLQWTTFAYLQLFHSSKKSLDEIDLSHFLDVIPFFQKALKVSMKCDGVGVEIVKTLSLLIIKSKNVNLPTEKLYDLVIGHSNFFNIILTDVKHDASLKEGVVDLLTALAKHDDSVCKEQHIGLFLGAYNGTMSNIDQKLLYLIKIYSDNGVNMIKYSPFLWGKAAISHYSIVNSGEDLDLLKQAKLKDVTSLISPDKIEKTIIHYPLKMTLQPSQEVWEDINKDLVHNIYDLRFFLPLLSNLLSPGSYVNINCFIESKLLLLIFASLSSYDSDLRALGYYCLSQFYHHLESWRSPEKEIWISLLDCLRNDLSSPNTKLPCIITSFLARVSEIFNKPNNSLYPILYKFIMIKPSLDVSHVPEFYKLFNSIELEHRIQRLWLLNLLSGGLRTSVDFHICEKRYIFSIMQSLCWSSLSSIQEKVSVLRVILSAVKIESSSRTLCQNGLLLWLHNLLEQCEINNEISQILVDIFDNVEKTVAENSSLKLLEKLKGHLLKSSLQLNNS